MFGVGTKGDLHELQDKEQAKLTKILNTTKTIEILTERSEDRIEDALIHADRALQGLLGVSARENRIEEYLQILAVLQNLNSVTFYLLSLGREIETRITLLQQGVVPHIWRTQQFRTILEDGTRKFPSLTFPFPIDYLNNENFRQYVSLVQAVSTVHPHTFVLIIPFTNKQATLKLYGLQKFPLKIKNDNQEASAMIFTSLTKYVAKNENSYVNMDNIKTCKTLEGKNTILCELKSPMLSNQVKACPLAIITNNTEMAKETCNYKISKFTDSYFALFKEAKWFIFLTSLVGGSINCPLNSGYERERLENFEGTLVVSPPCSFSSTLLSLPTINTAIKTVAVDPIKTIEQIHLNFVNETDIQTNYEVIALEKNIETLRNFSVERNRIVTQELEKINDVTVTHSTAIGFSAGIVLIVILIVVCCFRYRSTVVPYLSFFHTSKSHSKSVNNKNSAIRAGTAGK